jgi:hypothetical protein
MSIPDQWLTYMANAERELALRPIGSPKKVKATGRLESPRMRQANRQTRNGVKAIYQEPNQYNQAQLARGDERWTTNLGGNCEPDLPHGKSTQSR